MPDGIAPKRGPLSSPAARAALALGLGLAAGILIVKSGSPAGASITAFLDPIGTLWVNAIRMTIVPLVSSLLIATIASAHDLRAVGKLGVRSVAVMVALLAVLAIFSGFVSPIVFDRLVIDPAAAASLKATLASTTKTEVPGFASWLVSIIPTNPVKAAADGAMLSLIVFAVIFASALARLPGQLRDPVANFFRAISESMLIVVGWVLAVAPIGVFALAVTMATKLGASSVSAVAFYLVAHILLIVVLAVIHYVVIAMFGKVSLATFTRACIPGQVVALTTRSSLAALPANMKAAREILHIPDRVASFVLPFGASVFRVNSAGSWIIMAIFVGKLYGIELSAADIATIGAASVVFSFAVPGIPSGGLFVIAPFFAQIGLPLEGIGILIALDAIPDMAKTFVNSTGHMTAAVLVAEREPPEALATIA